MGKLAGFVAQRPHLFLLLLYPLVTLGFIYCELTVTHPRYIIEWPSVDSAIPFVPWMVGPYLFWYIAVAFAFIWLGVRDGKEFTRLAWFVYGGMTSAFAIYLLLPNGEALRPSLEGLKGWDVDAVRWVYAHDSPENVCPSLHVVDTMAVWLALLRDKLLGSQRWFRITLAVTCVAIIASTVMVKQHSILDIAAGLGWSALWWVIVYWRRPTPPRTQP